MWSGRPRATLIKTHSSGQWPVNTVKAYKIKIKEHEEYGELGLLVDVGRPYFDPLSGINVAHDILEHPFTPHPNWVVDELMAIGGIVAGRIECGWRNPKGYRAVGCEDISSDISKMARDCFYSGNDFCKLRCNTSLRDKDLVGKIKRAIWSGIREAEDDVQRSLRVDKVDVDSSAAWVCRGYQAYRRRFRHLDNYTLSTHLFDKITTIADNFLKTGDEGREGILCVDFNRYNCFVRDSEEGYY